MDPEADPILHTSLAQPGDKAALRGAVRQRPVQPNRAEVEIQGDRVEALARMTRRNTRGEALDVFRLLFKQDVPDCSVRKKAAGPHGGAKLAGCLASQPSLEECLPQLVSGQRIEREGLARFQESFRAWRT